MDHHIPTPAPGEKTTLVLSDSELLLQIIVTNLYCPVRGVCFDQGERIPPVPNDKNLGLIIVALSSPSGEPVVALSRAEVIQHLGRVPVLIISYRHFGPLPGRRIYYLPFPFDAAALRQQVGALLAGSGL